MIAGDRCAECGHRMGHAELMQRDDVEITFDHHQTAKLAIDSQCLVQAEQFTSFVEDLGFGRVQVFRLTAVDDPPAKADHASASVVDGEHHPFAKPIVVSAAFALDSESGTLRLLFADTIGSQHVQQIAPARGRES